MKKLLVRHTKLAKEVGVSYANHLFESFQKPEYRGSAFTWAKFPEIVAGMAEAHAAMSFGDWDKLSSEVKQSIRQTAKDAAEQHAKQLLVESPQPEK